MIKKIVILLIVVSNVFLFTGCWDSIEIDESEFVAGVAVDKGKNGYKYHMAAEIINLKSGENSGDHTSKVIEVDANTLIDATRKLITVSAQKLYLGHCKILIISDKVAKEGIIPILDVFRRHFTSGISIDILIAKDTEASALLSTKGNLNSPHAHSINKMLDNNKLSLSGAVKTRLFDAINEINEDGISLTIPALELQKEKDESSVKLCGTAIFDEKDKLVGFLNLEESKYFLLATDRFESGPITTKAKEKENLYISALISSNNTSTKFDVIDDELTVNLKIDTVAVIAEMGVYNSFKDNIEFSRLQAKFENDIQNNIKSSILNVQNNTDSDIFGFGKTLNESNPKLWESYKSNWNQTFKKLKVNVESHFKIKSTENSKNELKVGE